jgi:hypothetical protein
MVSARTYSTRNGIAGSSGTGCGQRFCPVPGRCEAVSRRIPVLTAMLRIPRRALLGGLARCPAWRLGR